MESRKSKKLNDDLSDKNIKIQLNATNRMYKEVCYYQTEINFNEKILKEMELNEKNKYDIKKQKEILDESFNVKRESIKKLKEYRENLEYISVKLETENKECLLLADINKLLQNTEYII
jgi:hypothetical protein